MFFVWSYINFPRKNNYFTTIYLFLKQYNEGGGGVRVCPLFVRARTGRWIAEVKHHTYFQLPVPHRSHYPRYATHRDGRSGREYFKNLAWGCLNIKKELVYIRIEWWKSVQKHYVISF